MNDSVAAAAGPKLIRWTPLDLISALVLSCLALLYHLTYVDYGPHNLIDTGHQLSDAVRVLAGEIYGRDFMTPYGPGTPCTLALLFSWLGTSLKTANIYWLVLQVVVDGGCFLLVRRLAPRWVAATATICLAMAYGPLHKGLVNMGLIGGMVILSWVLARPGRRRAMIGAILLLLSGLFRWDVAVDGLIGILVALCLRRRPGRVSLRWFAGGIAGGALVVAGIYVVLGHPLEMIRDEWARIVTVQNGPRLPDPILSVLFGSGGPSAAGDPWTAILFAANDLALLGGIVWASRSLLTRRGGERTALLAGVTLTGLLALPQILVAPKYERLSETWGLAVVLGAWLGWAVLRRVWGGQAEIDGVRAGSRRWLRGAVVGLFAVPPMVLGYYDATRTWSISQASYAVRRYATRVIDLPRGGTRTAPMRAERLVRTIEALQGLTEPGEPIYVTPSAPLIYFLSDRRNPTRYCDFLYYFERPEAQRRMIEEMEVAGVRIAVFHDKDILGYSIEESAPLLAAWVKERFVPIPGMTFGRYTILRQRE